MHATNFDYVQYETQQRLNGSDLAVQILSIINSLKSDPLHKLESYKVYR